LDQVPYFTLFEVNFPDSRTTLLIDPSSLIRFALPSN